MTISNRSTAGSTSSGRGVARLVVSLDHPLACEADRTGGKAATLARLAAEGFPVPPGVVLTVEGTAPLLESSDPRDRAARDGGASGEALTTKAPTALPEALCSALFRELEHVVRIDDDGDPSHGLPPLAVRSSAVGEDGREASWAGQYESILGVQGREEMEQAVLRCLASARSARVAGYRADMSGGSASEPPPRLAVLIQPLLPADYAGVAFTADPVSGERDQVHVHAVRGLGDRLVAGEVSPRRWVVWPDKAELRHEGEGELPHDVLDESLVRTIAELARRVEELEGCPQDVEWVVTGDTVHLVQARPITALPVEPEIELPEEGTWLKDATHFPVPMTPLGADLALPAMSRATERMCSAYGLLVERVEMRSVGGEIYSRPIPVGGKDGPPPPRWIMAMLVRLVPSLRGRLKRAREVVRNGELEAARARWFTEWRPEVETRARELLRVNLQSLEPIKLEEHLNRTLVFVNRAQEIHFLLFIPYLVPLYDLATFTEEHLGWDPPRTLRLLQGLSEASSAPTRELRKLGRRIRRDPEAGAIVESGDDDALERLAAHAPALARELDAYLDRFGARVLGYDPGVATLRERPDVVLAQLRSVVMGGPVELLEEHESTRRRARDEALADLDEGPLRIRFEELLAEAEEAYPLREENVVLTDSVAYGLFRYAALEVGHRLAARGALARADDVFYLRLEELRRTLEALSRDESLPDGLRSRVSRRRAERAWVLAHPGPHVLGPEPAPPPDMRALPPEARRLNSAIQWAMDQEFAVPEGADDEQVLTGVAGSPGRYEGPARVVRDEGEFHKVGPGDVLVCPVTTPTWSILFGTVGALVTDGGSALAHAAIVAREHGIPCVVATGGATKRFHDGQTLSVDGSRGTVAAVEADG